MRLPALFWNREFIFETLAPTLTSVHVNNVTGPIGSHCRSQLMLMDLCILGELPQNCKEVKRLKGASEDGEYFLVVTGKLLKVLVRAQSLFLRCFQSQQPWLSWARFQACPGRFCLVCLSGLLCRDAL